MRRVPLIVTCASCDRVMRRVTLPANHDRAGITFLRCDDCGAQERHEIIVPQEHPAPIRQLEARGETQSAANFGAPARGCVSSEIRGRIGLRSEAAKRHASFPIPVQSSSSVAAAAKLPSSSSAGHSVAGRQALHRNPAHSTDPVPSRQASGQVVAIVPFSFVAPGADHVRREMNSRIGDTQGVGNPTQARGNFSRACG